MITIKDFDPNKIKIDENWCKNILICYIKYVTIKDSKYVKIKSVNPLYLLIGKMNGCFKEINENKYLTLFLLMKARKKRKNTKNCGVKSGI